MEQSIAQSTEKMRLMQGSDWSLPTEAEGEEKMMEKSMAPTWPFTQVTDFPNNEPTKQMDKRGDALVDWKEIFIFSQLLFWLQMC